MRTVAPTAIAVGSSRDRVRRHREAMRAQGYRTVTLWLPDSHRPGFAEECRKQSEMIRQSDNEKNYLDELDLPEVEGWS